MTNARKIRRRLGAEVASARRSIRRICAAAAVSWALILAGAAEAADCTALTRASIPGLEGVEARVIPAGGLPQPTERNQGGLSPFLDSPALADLPAFCRVTGSVATSPSTRIRIEMWLPEQNWNGRFLPGGWSFYAGSMSPSLMTGQLLRGYATATTDGGGIAGQASFLLNQPEKLIDWGERAWRETTIKAKALITAYYGRPPDFTYWNGGGGASRQGLKAVQRFPDDYDAVVVGGLAHDPSHSAFAQIANWRAIRSAEPPLTVDHFALLHRAVLSACDTLDGLDDGLVGDPESCRFDPAVLRCPGAAASTCLTEQQIAAVRRVYAPVTNPRTGTAIFPGIAPGSEPAWRTLLGPGPAGGSFPQDFFRYVVFGNPNWDDRMLDYDRDVAVAERVHPSVNATDADISAFVARGGKMLIWGGWSDLALSPWANVDYYKSVVAKLGAAEAARAVRLYMVPGMGHFLGTPASDAYELDTQRIIEAWRERGEAPDRVVAVYRVNGVQKRTVLLCPYPQVAHYGGRGDPADAANFGCRNPR